jgi:type IV secretion/conjugal transfer VirB4 family ATPase
MTLFDGTLCLIAGIACVSLFVIIFSSSRPKVVEHQQTARGLADLLLYASLVDDGVMLLQDGALMAGWSFSGPDLATATHEEMDSLTRRLNNVLRLGSGWMIHCDTIRTASPDYPKGASFPDAVSYLIDEERRAQFTQEGSHFESEYFIVLTYLPPAKTEEAIRGFMFEGGDSKSRPTADRALEFFKKRIGAFDEVFSSQFKTKRLKSRVVTTEGGFSTTYDDLLSYIRRCVTGEDFPFIQPEIPVFLHDQIACRDLCAGVAPILGKKHMRVVAIDGFPHTSYPGMLAALDTLPFEYRWNTRAILLDPEHAKGYLTKHLKKWRGAIRGFLDQLLGRQNGTIDQHALGMTADANNALAEASAGDVQFAFYSANVVVLDENAELADSKAAQVAKTLQNLGFAARSETVNAVDAWRGSLPGDGYRNVRRILLHTLNLADCLPIAAVWTGERTNPSPLMPPNSSALMYATSIGSTAFRANLHNSDIAHTLVLGPTGAGKSVLLGTLAAQFFRYPGAQVFTFDKGYSMQVLTLAMGGENYDIGGPTSSKLNFCPLAELDTPSDVAWAVDYIENLCRLAGQNISPQQRNEILAGVTMLKDSPERTMTELVVNIQDEAIKGALQHYTLNGSLGVLLEASASNNALGTSRFMNFEMEHLMNFGDKGKAVCAVLLYLFRQIEKRLDGSPTLIFLDEAWVFLQNEQFSEFIQTMLKTYRKKNGGVVLATQSISDVMSSPIRDVILESCPTKILLPNAEAGNEISRKFYMQLGCNSRTISTIQNAIPKRQYLFTSPIGRRLVSLGLGPVALAFVGVSDTESRAAVARMVASNPVNWQEMWLRKRGLDRWADFYAQRCVPLFKRHAA